MKANEYKLMEDCVERGINAGYQKAFKHSDNPPEEEIKQQINHYIMLEICEYFTFNNIEDEKN